MGLDLRLSYKDSDNKMVTIYEGNGRTAFDFVKKWVINKGIECDEDLYGKDIQLTKYDVEMLIIEASKQYLDDFDNVFEIIKDALNESHIWYYTEFLGKLLAIKGSELYEQFYLECDW